MLRWLIATALLISVTVPMMADEFLEPFSSLWGWNPPKMLGKVKAINQVRYFLNGEPATQPASKPDALIRFTFDEKGRTVQQAGYVPPDPKPIFPSNVTFDEKGRREQVTFHSASGDVSSTHVMTWDADGMGGKIVVNDFLNPEHKPVVRDTGDVTFDTQGRVKQIKYNMAGGGVRYIFYSFLPDGSVDTILKSTKPDPAEGFQKITYKYNDKGFVVEEDQLTGKLKFGPGGTETKEWTSFDKMQYTYEYDATGNWVRRMSINTGAAFRGVAKPYHLTLRTIEYAK